MENVKANGEASPTSIPQDDKDTSPAAGSGEQAAKSVISINKNNVTIISTGKDGQSKPAKVTTTPLRTGQDPSLTGATHVSTRVKDTQFVSALTQKFQANGTLLPPTGYTRSSSASSTPSSRASVNHSRSSSNSSSVNEDLTSKLSAMLLQQQQQQQQQQPQQTEAGQKNGSLSPEQILAEDGSSPQGPCPPTPPSEGVNGAPTPNGRGSGASSPEIPPPPPPSALMRSISEQPQLRKVDASYSPRPKSYSTQNSAVAGNGGSPQVHNKHDLMAALTAVVTSGSPVSGLRKTRGPGRGGGVTEVYTSKKSPPGSSTSATGADATANQRGN